MPSIFSFILAHQGDAADPELLRWIKLQLDHIFGAGPWAVVAIMGVIILSVPVLITVFYLMQSNRRAAAEAPLKQDGVNQDAPEQERVP